jgi:hypothetical protein
MTSRQLFFCLLNLNCSFAGCSPLFIPAWSLLAIAPFRPNMSASNCILAFLSVQEGLASSSSRVRRHLWRAWANALQKPCHLTIPILFRPRHLAFDTSVIPHNKLELFIKSPIVLPSTLVASDTVKDPAPLVLTSAKTTFSTKVKSQ